MGSSAWAPVAESSASGWTPVREDSPSALSQVGTSIKNQAKGLYDLLITPVSGEARDRVAKGILDAHKEQFEKAQAAYKSGDYAGVIHHTLGTIVPLVGPLIENTAEKATTGGRPYEAATDLLLGPLISKGLEMAPAAAALTKSVPGKIAAAVDQPGLTKILGGAGEVGAGAGAMTTGHPVAMVYGAGSIAKGISRVSKGLAERRAAISEAIQAAADKAAAEQAALTSGPTQGAQRQPIWAGAQPQAEASPVPIGPTQRPVLPSNRAPYNQDAAPANVVEMPQPSPLAKWVRSQDSASASEQSAPQSLPVRPAARPTIAQIEPQPKAYDSKAAVKRQTDQAFKMADILKQADITPGDLADLTMDHWKQVGEATGLGPPSPYSIQRARFELSKISDAPQVSPELAAQLKRKGALSIAQQLADEMQK